MQLDDLKYWNDVFHSKFPKYKDQLDAILDHLPLVIISVKSHTSHVFSNLQNCLITINCVTFPLVESMNTSLLANQKLVFCDLQVGASSNHVGEQKENFPCRKMYVGVDITFHSIFNGTWLLLFVEIYGFYFI